MDLISGEPPPYYVSDTLRRRKSKGADSEATDRSSHSEGSDADRPQRGRRVSFEVGEGDAESPRTAVVRCRYSKCNKTASLAEARRSYKTCHNCNNFYCSRECRRSHWEKHRKTCMHSRVGALCKQVIATIREEAKTLYHVSLLARQGYLSQGRGCVKTFFSSPEMAERFVACGYHELSDPCFLRWADLLPNEMGTDLYQELIHLCKTYNPDTRFVLYVSVCVVNEVPTSGAVKWERQLISRCAKLRLCRSLTPATAPASAPSPVLPARRIVANITRDMENPETMILTSLPGCQGNMPPQRAREISFTNIQRHLRQRGVSLRRQFPDIYKRLCAYVENSEPFTPVTIYPRDALSGKSFMCIIMPDAEPERLQLVPKDSSHVQTIDISLEQEYT